MSPAQHADISCPVCGMRVRSVKGRYSHHDDGYRNRCPNSGTVVDLMAALEESLQVDSSETQR